MATAEDRAASAGLPAVRGRKRSIAATAMLGLWECWPDVRPRHKKFTSWQTRHMGKARAGLLETLTMEELISPRNGSKMISRWHKKCQFNLRQDQEL
jgi:hypothetical protein